MALLTDKVVLVTGAASGIGKATAEVLSREGATVVVCDIVDEASQETTNLIKAGGGSTSYVQCNVANAQEVKAMVNAVISRYGRLDGAYNNAGIEGVAATTAEYPEDEWDQVLTVNLKGIWLCMKYEIQAMLKTGGGSIVNTSSALGKVGISNLPAYVASKHGVIGVTRAAALDHAQQGIRINAIAPGVIDTPLMARRIEEMPEIEAPLKAAHPMGRLGKTREVGEAVAWLLSDGASFVHGEVLSVDGGYLAV